MQEQRSNPATCHLLPECSDAATQVHIIFQYPSPVVRRLSESEDAAQHKQASGLSRRLAGAGGHCLGRLT